MKKRKVNMPRKVEKHCREIAKETNITYMDCWPVMLEYEKENKLGYAALFDIGTEHITINFALEEIKHHLLSEHIQFVKDVLDRYSTGGYNENETQ